MKKFKKALIALVSVCMITSLPVAAGCADSEDGTHTHTFATTWSTSETEHWKAATCEHTTEVSEKAAHTFDGNTCTVCNYTKSGDITPPDDNPPDDNPPDDGDTMGFTKLTKNAEGYYVLEAEYTDVTAIEGTTYSGQAVGENIIVKDYGSTASNGFYVNYLYRYGNTLIFDIYLDKAVTCELVLRLAPYYQPNYTLESSKYSIFVAQGSWDNDAFTASSTKGVYYNTINLGGDYIQQNNNFNNGGFKDYTVSTSVQLSAGYNRIMLVTNNNDKYAEKGDMSATAPAVDCIKIKADATLKMDVWDSYGTLK